MDQKGTLLPTHKWAGKCSPEPPGACHYGSLAGGALTSPGNTIADFKMFKNWKLNALGEQGRVHFRSEFFNVMNHPNFGVPDGISFSTLDTVAADGPRDGEIRGLRTPMRIVQLGVEGLFSRVVRRDRGENERSSPACDLHHTPKRAVGHPCQDVPSWAVRNSQPGRHEAAISNDSAKQPFLG